MIEYILLAGSHTLVYKWAFAEPRGTWKEIIFFIYSIIYLLCLLIYNLLKD